MKASVLIEKIASGAFDSRLAELYSAKAVDYQRQRYIKAVNEFVCLYGEDRESEILSVPGRSEILGNHTDHNRGCVLAAAIDLDIIAVASARADGKITLKSEGFDADTVDSADLNPESYENYSSSALIAGVCRGFCDRGYAIGGFDAYTTSNVYKGSGLSSSAAFEVMIGNILNQIYNGGGVDAPTIAKIAQFAENVFFGKPCGLMDQTACAVGGFVAIDFEDPTKPIIEKMDYDLSKEGYALCITNTGGNHADLNEDYASIPTEMKAVASHFGRDVLRGMSASDVTQNIAVLREKFGDRAILRALHFIAENDRVRNATEALKKGDTGAFFDNVKASGESSFMWLQNIYTTKNVSEQGLSLALAVMGDALGKCSERSAYRVHGGGFAGTVQAFVPIAFVKDFTEAMDAVFGKGSCRALRVRADGAIKVI